MKWEFLLKFCTPIFKMFEDFWQETIDISVSDVCLFFLDNNIILVDPRWLLLSSVGMEEAYKRTSGIGDGS